MILKSKKALRYNLPISFFMVCLIQTCLFGQSPRLPINHIAYHLADRQAILSGIENNVHIGMRDLSIDMAKFLLDTISHSDKKESLFFSSYLNKELFHHSEKPEIKKEGLWSTFYVNPAFFYDLKTADFSLRINPFFNINIGQDQTQDDLRYLNQRGIEVQGSWDQKFFFYSALQENQGNFFDYINRYIDTYQTIPGQGHFKPYGGGFGFPEGFDFGNTHAYLGYKTSKHSYLELGHGRHFVGHGIRSLLLSDFAQNYFYLKFDLQIWKIHYRTIFAELNAHSTRQTAGNSLVAKKYMATHTLSVKPHKNLEFALFESVIFSRENHFEFQYLNPVILYRSVEHFLDSPDNVLLGFNANWRFLNGMAAYGQIIFDELRTSELFSGNGWWGNKYGLQLGLKYYDMFNIPFLDGQLEYNIVRPYTYSHNVESSEFPVYSISSYSHFNQALAHPLGANFKEVIVSLRYQCLNRLSIHGRFFYTTYGRSDNTNIGQDILLSNESRIGNFGINQNQGDPHQVTNFDLTISYMIVHDLNIDFHTRFRQDKEENTLFEETKYWGIGLRYNIDNIKVDY